MCGTHSIRRTARGRSLRHVYTPNPQDLPALMNNRRPSSSAPQRPDARRPGRILLRRGVSTKNFRRIVRVEWMMMSL